MTFLEWIVLLGPMNIIADCCIKPVGGLFLFFGIVLVKQYDIEDVSERPRLWAGAFLIVLGVVLLIF